MDTVTFKNSCPDSILESDHFPGKWGMVLACGGGSAADPEENTQSRDHGITFHYNRIPDHKRIAKEYCCPPETF